MTAARPTRRSKGFLAGRIDRLQRRRRAKKARVRAMPRKRRYLRRSLIAGTWLLGFVAVIVVAVVVAFYTLTDVPRPESLPLPQVATIEYSDGSTLARIGSVDRTIVTLDQVPASTRWAVLAAEDRGFYTEHAVSLRGTARAAVTDIKGGDTQGGSGITQQYVKNAYLSNEQTLSRKLKELLIAVKLSREYTKDQILGFYLNTVYFGRNTYGIQAAAEAYFGENASQLTTAQGAVLAGLLRAPAYYDPADHPHQSQLRWRYVLDGMVATGHLSAAQEAKLTFPQTKAPRGTGLGTTGWKYLLTNAVLADLRMHGIGAAEVSARGLIIRTTISRKAQGAALTAIRTTFAGLTPKQRNLKTALVAVDPASGGVLAYYGGTGPGVRGYDGRIDYNDYAGVGSRPPGSSFKPYVLATALTQTVKQTVGDIHYAIDSLVDGRFCTKIEGTKICNDPSDKDVSSSSVTIADAMKYSLNTTFDGLAAELGPAKVAAIAHRMGIAERSSNGTYTLQDATDGSTSFGIGIGDYPVTVLDQANGYATLADRGIRNDAYLVQSARASNGALVYTHRADPVRAIDPKVANDVALTMTPIAEYSGDALADGRGSAAKTGTEGIFSADPKHRTSANSDAWMVGFTPQVSAAVWVGSGSNAAIVTKNGNPVYGSGLPGRTWQRFMDTYLQGQKLAPMPDEQMIDIDGTTPDTSASSTPSGTDSSPAGPSDSTSSSAPGSPTSPTGTGSTSNAPSSPAPGTSTRSSPTSTATRSPTATCTPTVRKPCG